MEQALEQFFAFVEGLENGTGWEGLMKVKADVCFEFLALADIVRHEHELVTVDPNRLRVDQLTDLMDPPCHPSIDSLELGPVIDNCGL